MRDAGRIVARVLERMRGLVRPGISTMALDEEARAIIAREGAVPSFEGYRGYPAAICASINEEIVHGIPSMERVLAEGDIVSIDVGTIYGGYQGDAAVSLPVGEVSDEARRLLEVTEAALWEGISEAVQGNFVGDVSSAIQRYVESRDLSVVREYTGHGIGRSMHEDPQVPNFGRPQTGAELKPGMTFALEPMVLLGNWRTRTLEDGWTVVTADGSLSAHFEHTIAVTEGQPEVLTQG
jgi:methionyl aminopeptidase